MHARTRRYIRLHFSMFHLASPRVKRSLALYPSNLEELPWRSYIPQWPDNLMSKRAFNTRGSSGGVIPMARIGKRFARISAGKRFWGQNEETEPELEKEVMIPTARIGRAGTMIPMARIGRSYTDNHYQIPMPRIG